MDAKDEVKERLSVEDVVGDYLELKRSGRNLKALSPFTGEKTASLMVSPEKQIWHDFSSNQGGDIFSFVMLMEGVDFKGALEILARKAGVDLSQYRRGDGRTAKRKQRLYEAMTLAVNYYHATMAKNQTARDYLVNKRGFGKEILGSFQLGYAPNSGHALLDFMKKRGFSVRELQDAGLVNSRNNRSYDMFRGRIMVPLHDGQGQAVGFTARVLDDSLPKYINTPQTLIYDKSRHVYGLHLAKETIRKQDFVVVAEGNLDVIASHKTAVKNIVATAGTAFTKEHFKQLYRLSNDVRLAFDTDRAGVEATERAIPVAQEVGVRLSIINIPSGKDPDELIQQDPKQWEQVVEQSTYVMDWLMQRYQAEYDLGSAEGKKRFTDKVLSVLARVKDPVEQEHYIRQSAHILQISPGAIMRKLRAQEGAGPSQQRKKRPKVDPKEVGVKEKGSAYQDLLIGLNMLYPDVQRSLKDLDKDMVEGDSRRALLQYVLEHPEQRIGKTPQGLKEIDDYVKIVLFKTEELYDSWSSSDRMIEAIGLARRLVRDNQQKRKKQLSEAIAKAEAKGDSALRQKLLQEFNQLIRGE